MKELDKLYLKKPYFGRPRLTHGLRELGYDVNQKRVGRLMGIMGIRALYPRPRTTIVEKSHPKYPYLVDKNAISHPNEVWCSDISYIPMRSGFLYLVAVMDWYSRFVLSWEVSNCMDVNFCLEALELALEQGTPTIFNTDKGGQYTSKAFTQMLHDRGVKISMTAKGAMDNIMIERLWRSVKYEHIYLHEYDNGRQLCEGLEQYFYQYNYENPHSSLGMRKPFEVWSQEQ